MMHRRSLRTMALATGPTPGAFAITVTAAEGSVKAMWLSEALGQVTRT